MGSPPPRSNGWLGERRVNQCTTTTKAGTRCRNELMPWYGIGEHPGVCARHATAEWTAASTAALDVPLDVASADPAAPFPDVSITPQCLICPVSVGWVAKIRGTNEWYVYARTFLSRSGQPYGWPLRPLRVSRDRPVREVLVLLRGQGAVPPPSGAGGTGDSRAYGPPVGPTERRLPADPGGLGGISVTSRSRRPSRTPP